MKKVLGALLAIVMTVSLFCLSACDLNFGNSNKGDTNNSQNGGNSSTDGNGSNTDNSGGTNSGDSSSNSGNTGNTGNNTGSNTGDTGNTGSNTGNTGNSGNTGTSGDNGNTGTSGTQISTTDLIYSCNGYEEGASVVVNTSVAGSTNLSDYSVSYATAGSTSYTKIDSQLIRLSGTQVRADILGLKAGNYDIKVVAKDKTQTKTSVAVTAYDRSGYAHFNYTSGVGAYNDDGTPKSNAVIVYVTEATKNTVVAKVNGSNRTGIVSILQNAGTSTPLIVRIIGTVGAATWNTIEYNANGKYSPSSTMPLSVVKGANGTVLQQKDWSQADLIKGSYNSLNLYPAAYKGAKCDELIGLSSKIKFDSSKQEFDSCWNDCSISGVKNVTVEGVGTDATIFQWGMTFRSSNSIEVRNLTFTDYTEDACSFEGNTSDPSKYKNFWVHHNQFNIGKNYWDVCKEQDKHDGDGSTDIKGISYVTFAYNHYIKTHKTGLVGGGDSHLTSNVTYHHNYYQQCGSRLPLARQANMHMYNNYYYKSSGTNMSLRANAYAFIEYCYFESASGAITTDSTGVAKVYQCTLKSSSTSGSVTVVTDRTKTVTNTNSFNKTFDTNTSAFYYDSTNKKSKVTNLIETANIPTQIPKLAGVHKI